MLPGFLSEPNSRQKKARNQLISCRQKAAFAKQKKPSPMIPEPDPSKISLPHNNL